MATIRYRFFHVLVLILLIMKLVHRLGNILRFFKLRNLGSMTFVNLKPVISGVSQGNIFGPMTILHSIWLLRP